MAYSITTVVRGKKSWSFTINEITGHILIEDLQTRGNVQFELDDLIEVLFEKNMMPLSSHYVPSDKPVKHA